MIRRLQVFTMTGLLLATLGGAETLQLRSGNSSKAAVQSFSAGKFYLEGGDVLTRDEVSSIEFQAGGTAATPTLKGPALGEKVKPVLKEGRVKAWNEQVADLEGNYPGFPATLVRSEVTQELLPDGTRKILTRYLYRVNKDAAIGYGSWRVSFDPARERVRVVQARTILADGSVLPLSPERSKVQDARSSSSNLTNKKILTWQLDGVRVGSYVEHIYEKEIFQPFKKDFFFPRFFFQTSAPLVRTRFTVITPEKQKLYWVGSDLGRGPVVHVSGVSQGKHFYTWQANKVAPLVGEPQMPGASGVIPRISCSLFEDWKPFFDWEAKNLRRNVEPDESIKEKAREVVGKLQDPEAMVAAIYRFLQEEIRYVSVKSGIGSGWSGHPAPETLKNGYGDCVDKAVLFSSLLATLGIESEPITIMTNNVRDMETRLPGLDANHCISQIHLGGRSFFLDSTTSNFRYPYFRSDDQGQPATNPLRGEIVHVPLVPPEENQGSRLLRLKLDADGTLDGEEWATACGTQEARRRSVWKRQKKRDQGKVFRDYYSAVAPGAQVLDFEVGDPRDFTKPMAYRARFRAKRYGVQAGKLMIVKIPFFAMSFREASLETRKYPIDYRSTSEEKVRWEITLPPGYHIKAAPSPTRVVTQAGSLELKVQQEEGRLILERTYRIEDPLVPVKDYPVYKKFLEELQALGQEQIFLEVES
jgi:transglutaminase-like putative cysteine protease